MSDINYVKINTQFLTSVGLWNHHKIKNPYLKYLFYTYTYVMYISFIIYVGTQYFEIYFLLHQTVPLVRNVYVTFLYSLIIMKVYFIYFRKGRVKKLFKMFRRIEKQLNLMVTEEQKLYEICFKHNLILTVLFVTMCAFTVLVFCVARPIEYYLSGPQEIDGYRVPLLLRYVQN